MGASFASMHIFGKDKDEIKELVLSNTEPLPNNFIGKMKSFAKMLGASDDDVEGFEELSEFEEMFKSHFYGKTGTKAYSLYSDKFGMESINEIAIEYFNTDIEATVLTIGLLDEDVLQLSVIKGGRVVSKVVLSDGCYEEFPPCMKNCKAFEWYFGITEEQIKNAIDENDYIKTCENFAELFDLPLDLSFNYIEEYNAQDFDSFEI